MSLRRTFSLFLLLAAGALTLGCPGPAWPKCENDDHCKSNKKGNESGHDFICRFGQCVECALDSHCDSGEKCTDGRCEKKCQGAADCASGLTCREGDCVAAVDLAPHECKSAADCKSGEACNREGKCIETSRQGGDASDAISCDDTATINFNFNEHDLTPEAREVLDVFAKCMRDNTSWKMTVSGHADERGTTMYNLDLGEKRAQAVKKYLVRLGADGGRIRTVSYGEERPISTASNESAWAQNRRCELVIKK